jgi:hypothetical protein
MNLSALPTLGKRSTGVESNRSLGTLQPTIPQETPTRPDDKCIHLLRRSRAIYRSANCCGTQFPLDSADRNIYLPANIGIPLIVSAANRPLARMLSRRPKSSHEAPIHVIPTSKPNTIRSSSHHAVLTENRIKPLYNLVWRQSIVSENTVS